MPSLEVQCWGLDPELSTRIKGGCDNSVNNDSVSVLVAVQMLFHLVFPLPITDEEIKVYRASGDMLKSKSFVPGGNHLPEMAGM